MDYIIEVQLKVFEAHKEFVKECFADWKTVIATRLKKDVEEAYPDGFKDYLLESIQNRIGALKNQAKQPKAIEE